MLQKCVKQICETCGKEFTLIYCEDGSYEYGSDACDCEGGFFSPINGQPSISQWLESIKKRPVVRMEEMDDEEMGIYDN